MRHGGSGSGSAASVTLERNGHPICTIEMCALGARLKSSTVMLNDLRLADCLIMALSDYCRVTRPSAYPSNQDSTPRLATIAPPLIHSNEAADLQGQEFRTWEQSQCP